MRARRDETRLSRWTAALGLAATACGLAIVVASACSSSPARDPLCRRDEQCVHGAARDYCLDGKCVHCRTSIDCGDREMCRGGQCKPDPNAPPPPVLDAGSDADDDGSAEDEAGVTDENAEESQAPPESPRHVLPRGVRRFFHP